jgi:cyclopropane fatty-acyl-phospholipid synthase-like methyltransferase
MPDSPQKQTIDIFQQLNRANAIVQCFGMANKIGVFDCLRRGQLTGTQLAEQLKLSFRPLELLMGQLCETGYVEKYGDDYALSMLGKMLPEDYLDLGDRYWNQLESWVRTGSKTFDPQQSLESTEYAIQGAALEWMSTPNAMDLIEVLNLKQGGDGIRVVDLACGSGVYGAAIGYHDQQARVFFVDQQDQLQRAKETAGSIDITDRCQFIGADPKAYRSQFLVDLVVIANRCRCLGDDQLGQLIQTALRCLQPEGEIAIIDQIPEEDHWNLDQTTEALSVEMRTPQGRLRTREELSAVLYANGFTEAMYRDLKSAPATHGVLIAGKKPGQ